ncbi:MAG TPA: phosphoribosylanthranilate isomerase [Candidatus Limnocylindrales bacterium]|nr:phosphoribosylanthranilate isomerase [Candidatus Limnocylindrales bacterium]
MRTRIKVCGITNADDARAALDAGADFIGLILTESPRRVTPEQARAIRESLPAQAGVVGVFASEPVEEVVPLARSLSLGAVQVAGWLEREELFPFDVWHVLRGDTLPDPTALPMVPLRTYHLDAFDPVLAGGTGRLADWGWARTAVQVGRRVIVAGGLTAENVEPLVLDVRPFGVDASSGLESSVGKKSPSKMRAFVERVRAADLARPKRS